MTEQKQPCIICGNLVPEKELPPYSGHKPDCHFTSEWNKEKSNKEVADKIGSDYQFLENLAEELCTQDNRATANPIYIVQQQRRIYDIDRDYNPEFYYMSKKDPEDTWDSLEELYKDCPEVNEDNYEDYVYEIGYIDIWQYVTAHLTQKAAELYIKQNGHNLNNPRIYVDSQYRCHEFNQLIDIIKRNF